MKIATNECPTCHENNLKAGYLNCDKDSAWRTITCETCGMCWNEVYTFSHNADIVTDAPLGF